MSVILSGLAPIFILIVLGYGLRHFRVVDDALWAPADRLNYVALFPALIIVTMARTDYEAVDVVPMAAAIVLSVGLVGAAVLASRRLAAVDGPELTSVFQGAVRFNSFVGLAIANALFGKPGLAMAALVIAVLIPVVNGPSIVLLARYGENRRAGPGALIGALVRNPILIACAIGLSISATGLQFPTIVGQVLGTIAAASLPIGLLSVGGGLDFVAVRTGGRAVILASVAKLAVLPAVTYLACELLGVGGVTQAIAVMFNALPASISSYALARQMGGDHRLMAAILTVQTLLAAVTLPVVLLLVK
ncbi:MAG: AEC family transporter [Alphaproteobacteria bacterium]|nr:AEC family transporter [Alphaproteobacteria bacterium]